MKIIRELPDGIRKQVVVKVGCFGKTFRYRDDISRNMVIVKARRETVTLNLISQRAGGPRGAYPAVPDYPGYVIESIVGVAREAPPYAAVDDPFAA